MTIKSFETEEMELKSSAVTVKITMLARDERDNKHIKVNSIVIPSVWIGDKKRVKFKIEIAEAEGMG